MLVCVLLAVTLALTAAASAAAAVQTITSAGPLTNIYIGDTLGCQVDHAGDAGHQFYPGESSGGYGSCGTFLWTGGAETIGGTYGPVGVSFGGPSFTPVSQTPVSGTGTSADPFTVVTVVSAGATGLTVSQTDTYVVGDETYRSIVTIDNSTGAEIVTSLYRGADCYLQDSDAGYGFRDLAGGGIYCSRQPNNAPLDRIEGFAPLSPGSHYFQGYWAETFTRMTGAQYPDTCDCTTFRDNGTGLSWSVPVPAGGSATRSMLAGFSPTGTVPPVNLGPPVFTDTDPDSPANDRSPKIKGTAEAGSTVSIYDTDDCTGPPAATGTAAAFASPGLSVSVGDNSTTTFWGTAGNADGTSECSTSTITYVEDSRAPAPPTVTATDPASPSNSNVPKVKGAAPGAATVTLYDNADCDGTPVGTGTAATYGSTGITATVPSDQPTTLWAKATDAALNVSACSTDSIVYVEDSTAPAVPTALVLVTASPADDNSPVVTGSAADGSTVKLYSSLDCTGTPVVSGSPAGFASPGLTAPVLDDTTTTFRATASDAAGNESACSDPTTAYVEDSTAPSLVTFSGTTPASPADDNSPKVAGSAEDASSVELYTTSDCTGDPAATGSAADFAAPGLTVTVADDSSTTVRAAATDAVGHASACSTDFVTYVEDSTTPDRPTALTVSPDSPANDNAPVVKGAAEDGSTVRLFDDSECDGIPVAVGPASTFTSTGFPLVVSDDTSATYYATSTDATGHESPCSEDSVTYVEDSTAPDAPSLMASAPGSPGNDNTPSIQGVAETGSTVDLFTNADCDGTPAVSGSAADYASPGLSISVADDSSTTVYARATDAAGNSSVCSEDSLTFVEDSTPSGATSILTKPSQLSNELGAAFTYSSADGDTRFECRLDTTSEAGFATCPQSGKSYTTVSEGEHTFSVRTLDAAGNAGAPTSYTWVVDRTGPDTTMTAGPDGTIKSNDPSFRFEVAGTEPGATLKCRLEGPGSATGSYAGCTSPRSYTDLADGAYTFRVFATDLAGNADPTPATRSFTVDTSVPAVTTPAVPPVEDLRPRYVRAVLPPGALNLDRGRGNVACVAERGPLSTCEARLVDKQGKLLAKGFAPPGAKQALDVRVYATKAGRRALFNNPTGTRTTLSLVARTPSGQTLRTGRPVRILASHRLLVLYPGRRTRLPVSVRHQLNRLARVLPRTSTVTCAAHTDGAGSPETDRALTLAMARKACALLRKRGVTGRLTPRGYGHDHPRATRTLSRRLVLRFQLPSTAATS